MVQTTGSNQADDKRAALQNIKQGSAPQSSLPKDMSGTFLAGEDLSGMDLSGVDFSGADLTGVNMSRSRLFRADFSKAILLNADLSHSEMSGANLSGADLENANMRSAGLGMGCLKDAHLFRTDMESVTLTKADLTGADMRCANLRRSRIREANLSGADFTGANMERSDLALCTVSKATFRNVSLRESRLRAITDFETADWIGVDIRDINFAGAYRMKRFIGDQNYLKEFREKSALSRVAYYIWWVTSDCGRSLGRWCIWIALQLLFFAWIYTLTGFDQGEHPTSISSIYFSVVTLTTLGYGDAVPSSISGQVVTIVEVLTGYIMLGGLLSIFSNKMARRGD